MQNKSVRILLIEDNPGDARLIRELLSETKEIYFDMEVCQTLSEGLKALASGSFEVILLDPGLPDSSGLESLIRTQAAAPHVAIIVLTGLDDQEIAVRSVRKGAQDYLVKEQITPDLLSKAVRYAVERKRTELEKDTISAISKLFLSSETLDETYDDLPGILSYCFQFPIVAVELYDRDKDEMVFVNSVGIPWKGPGLMRVPVSETISGYVALTGEPLSEVNASQRTEYQFDALNVETFLCVPMKIRGQVLGVLSLADCARREDVSVTDTLRIIADYLGQEIARKRANEELQKAKEAAEAASQAKNAFLSVISHELRTPLSQIIGFSEILRQDQSLTEEQREDVEIINSSGDHLLTIINDLIELCMFESGKMTLNVNEMNLPGFLEKIVNMFQVQTRQKGISLTTDFAPDLPELVYADEGRLRQILINILGNAVKFTQKGGIVFRVASQTEGRIRFQVEDTGIGIPADQSREIFSMFHQAGYYLHHTEGLGLGLSVSQRLAEMMGTSLHVSSAASQGSTFWFDVRLQNKKAPLLGHKHKALIVADQEINRVMLSDMLTILEFHNMEKAADPDEAYDKAAKCRPDLIIMDMAISGPAWINAIQQIRQIPGLKNVIIIAIISADVFDNAWDGMKLAGCNDFILKPADVDDLETMAEIYLG